MNCCVNDLGLKAHNQDINLNDLAAQAGEYKFILDFNGAKITKRKTFDISDDLVVPAPFNENYIYTMTVEQPDGTPLVIDDCANFMFKTYISIEEDNDCDSCDDDETETYS